LGLAASGGSGDRAASDGQYVEVFTRHFPPR
jgi:hypothetical protein